MMVGNPAKAIEPAERAVKLDPLSTSTHVFLGEIYLANNAYKKALNEAHDARKLQPEYGVAHFIEGVTFYHLKKYSEAEISFKQALDLTDPNASLSHQDIQSALAVTQSAGNKFEEALEILYQVQHSKKLYAAGLIQASLGEYEKALKSFKEERNWGAFSTPMMRYFYPELLNPIRSSDEYKQIIQSVNKCWNL